MGKCDRDRVKLMKGARMPRAHLLIPVVPQHFVHVFHSQLERRRFTCLLLRNTEWKTYNFCHHKSLFFPHSVYVRKQINLIFIFFPNANIFCIFFRSVCEITQEKFIFAISKVFSVSERQDKKSEREKIIKKILKITKSPMFDDQSSTYFQFEMHTPDCIWSQSNVCDLKSRSSSVNIS